MAKSSSVILQKLKVYRLDKFYLRCILKLTFILIAATPVNAQITVSGTVYDITKKTPVEAVSVLSTGGRGTLTDSVGRYSLVVRETDSIYFSYLNKPTPKYPVANIPNLSSFDISILKKVAELPSVFVRPRNYKLDSMENRRDYARIFNYKKPGLSTTTTGVPGAVGVGLDINELINMFRFKKNKRMLAFQNRLLREEQDKYIDHRFTKGLVRKLTGATSPRLEEFMKQYRPTYEMLQQMNELEFGHFIQEAYKYYATKTGKAGTSADR